MTLDPDSLETSIETVRETKVESDRNAFLKTIYHTRYEELLNRNIMIDSGGIYETHKNGYVLSIDLCPSTKYLDISFFKLLIQKRITPIYICVSGKWMMKHKRELHYLSKIKSLDIKWVNHTFNHNLDKCRLTNSFKLSDNSNLEFEILNCEAILIEQGLTPSIYFRFPGLLTNRKSIERVKEFGLIPLGSNSWLAKKQEIKCNSIILVHANGNEPEGLEIFENFLKITKLKPQYI